MQGIEKCPKCKSEDIERMNSRILPTEKILENILKRNFPEFEIIKIPHYARRMSKENYREQVKEILKMNNF